MPLALTVISWTALYPKSITFSGWPSAKLASIALPSCPVSVDAVAYPRRSATPIEGYQISPDQPPFPMPMNLPFQPDAGIHTSNLMSESFVGLISPATRQNAGRLSTGGPGKSMGQVNVPAGWDLAKTIVVSRSASAARFSQVAALADRTAKASAAEKAIMDACKARRGIAKGVADART